jgi:hypothetical protein
MSAQDNASELRRLHSDVFWTEKGHFTMAGIWRFAHLAIGVIATVGAALASAGTIAELQPVINASAALVAAMAAGLLTFLKPDEVAERHSSAGRRLGELRVELRQTHNLDVPLGATPELRKRIAVFAQRKVEIDDQAPHLANLAVRRVEKRKARGDYGHEDELKPS